MNKIGELRHRIFSFIKAGHRDIEMSPPSALAKSIAALWFKILTKIKGKIHGSKFGFDSLLSPIFLRCSRTLQVSYWMEYNYQIVKNHTWHNFDRFLYERYYIQY